MQQAGSVEIDDPVVKKLPVYLPKALLKKLYIIFQYPLRSKCSSKTEKPTVVASRIKPNAQNVELEFKIPTNKCNYDHSKGEQIFINVDGPDKHNPDQTNFFTDHLMDKINYISTKALLDPGRYAVGMFSKNELHLSPIHGILYVEASFPYLDKSDKTLKVTESNREIDGTDTAESADDEDGGDQVTVKFARAESDEAKATREKSFGYLQKKNAEEHWICTRYYKDTTEESLLERNGFLCQSMDDSTLNMSLPKDEFMSGWFRPCPEADKRQKLVATESMPMVRNRKLPPAQIQKLLDENGQFLQTIQDYQVRDKVDEIFDVEQSLHWNPIYLASVADPTLNTQNMLPASQGMPSILGNPPQRAQPPADPNMPSVLSNGQPPRPTQPPQQHPHGPPLTSAYGFQPPAPPPVNQQQQPGHYRPPMMPPQPGPRGNVLKERTLITDPRRRTVSLNNCHRSSNNSTGPRSAAATGLWTIYSIRCSTTCPVAVPEPALRSGTYARIPGSTLWRSNSTTAAPTAVLSSSTGILWTSTARICRIGSTSSPSASATTAGSFQWTYSPGSVYCCTGNVLSSCWSPATLALLRHNILIRVVCLVQFILHKHIHRTINRRQGGLVQHRLLRTTLDNQLIIMDLSMPVQHLIHTRVIEL